MSQMQRKRHDSDSRQLERRARRRRRLIAQFRVGGAIAALVWSGSAAWAQSTWTGATDNLWSTPTNWTAAPTDGSALIFTGTSNQTNTNDTALTNIGLLTLRNAGWDITAGTLTLNAGLTATGVSTVTGTFTLGAAQSIVSNWGTLTLNGSVDNAGNLLTFGGLGDVAVGAAISGGGGLAKTGLGVTTLGAANIYSGATTISGGTLALAGSGTLASTAGITLTTGGAFTIDNTATNLANRVAGGGLASTGGTFNFLHDGAAATNYAESTIGALTLNAGNLAVNTSRADAGQTSAVTFASVTRAAGGTARFSGTGLGADTRNQVIFTTAPALSSGILPWAIISTDGGTTWDFATHGGNGTSVAAFTAYTTSNDPNTTWTAATVNARPSSTTLQMSANRTVNSLILDNGVNVAGGNSADRTLTVGAGGFGTIVQTGGTSTIQRNGNNEIILAYGTNEGIFNVLGTLNIERNGVTTLTGSGGITKTGPGALVLGNNTDTQFTIGNTGVLRLNEGLMEVFSNSTGSLNTFSAYHFNGGSLTIHDTAARAFNKPVVVNADGTITSDRRTNSLGAGFNHTFTTLSIGSQKFSVVAGPSATSGTMGVVFSGTTTLTGTPTFAPMASSTANGLLQLGGTVTGANGIIKSGTGTLQLSGASNTFTGSTTVTEGTLQLTFTSNNNQKISNTASLILGGLGGTGGAVVLESTNASNTTFSVSDLVLNAGANSFALAANTTRIMQVNAGPITRNAGAVLTVTPTNPTTGALRLTTTTTPTNGIYGYGVVGSDWASSGVLAVTGITGGTGYTAAPRVVITGGGGSGAIATATVAGNAVTGLTILDPGSGYTSAPTFTFVSNVGSGAAVTGVLMGVVGTNPLAYVSQNDASLWQGNQNITNTAAYSNSVGTLAINSLRFNTPTASTVTVTGALTLASGGLMVTPNVAENASTITGGQLTSGNGQDVVVFQNSPLSTLTIASEITGAIGLTKAGAGTLALTGANTFTGDTYVLGGTVRAVDAPGALGAGVSALAIGAATVELAGDSPVAFNRNTALLGASTTTLRSDRVTAGAGVTHTLGTLTVGGKTLAVTNGSNVTSGTATVAFGDTVLTGPTTFNVTNSGSGAAELLISGGVNNNGNLLTVTGTGATTLDGALSGAGGVAKSGTGTLTLGAANTFSGGLTVGGGVVRAENSANALGTGAVTLAGGDLQLANDSGLTFTNSVSVTALSSVTVDRLTGGAGVTHGVGALALAGQPLLVTNGSNVTSGTAGLSATGLTQSAATTVLVNNAGSGATQLTVTGNVVIGNNALTLGGSGNTVISGTFTGGGTGGLTKFGTGQVTLSGSANTIGGATTVNAGTLVLDYGTNNDNKIATAAALNLGGGTLSVLGSAAGATSQTVASTTLNAGASGISVTTGLDQNATLALGAITRNAGGTLNLTLTNTGTGVAAVTTTTGNQNNILGGYATVNGADWATVTAGSLGAFTGYTTQNDVTLWAANQHITNNGAFTGTRSTGSIGSLRFNDPSASTVTITAANTLSIGSGTQVSGILVTSNVGANDSTITGGTLTVTGSTSLVLQQYNTAGSLIITSTIGSGAASLDKSGPGLVVLGGSTNNLLANVTNVNQGTLELDKTGTALALNGNLTIRGGATVRYGASGGTNQIVDTAAVTIARGTLDLATNGASDTVGAITLGGEEGTAAITTGTGTLTIGGNVTYTNTGNAVGSISGNLNLGTSVTRTFSVADGAYANDLTVDAAITSGASANLTVNGAGTLVLGGGAGDTAANTYTGLTTHGGTGTVVLNKADGTNAIPGNLTVNAGATVLWNRSNQVSDSAATVANGTLNLNGYNETIGSLSGTSTAAVIALGGGTLTVNQTGSGTYNGTISGAGGLAVRGGSTLIAGNTNQWTYTGGTQVSGASTLQNGTATNLSGRLPSTTVLTLGDVDDTAGILNLNFANGGQTLTVAGLRTLGLAGTSNAVNNNGGNTGGVFIINSDGTYDFNGQFTHGTGVFPVRKTGGGIQILSNDSLTYGGQFQVQGGVLRIQTTSGLGLTTANTVVSSGAALEAEVPLFGAYSVAEPLNLSGAGIGGTGALRVMGAGTGQVTWTGALTLGANATIGVDTGTLGSPGLVLASTTGVSGGFVLGLTGTGFGEITSPIVAPIGLVKSGSGTWTLSNATNDYRVSAIAGGLTDIRGGTLRLGATGNLPVTAASATAIQLANSLEGTATLDLNDRNATISALTFGGSQAGGNSAGVVTTGTGTLTLAGTLTYDATNNPLGATIDGNLSLGSADRTFQIDDSTASTDVLINAPVSGGGGIRKLGAGQLTLTGTSTFSGTVSLGQSTPSFLTGGNVVLTGATGSAAGAGRWTVNAGSVLTLDNSGGNNTNRIGDQSGIELAGGTFSFIDDGTGTTETVGVLSLLSGSSTVQVSGGGTTTVLTFTGDQFARSSGATVKFSATNLGTDAQIRVTDETGFIANLQNGLIGPWAVADDGVTFGFATYTLSQGVAPLVGTTNQIDDSTGPTDNVFANVAQNTLTDNRQANTIVIDGAYTVDLDAFNLEVGALMQNNSANTILSSNGGALQGPGGVDELILVTNTQLTITAPVGLAGDSFAMTKLGVSTLVLSGTNEFTGDLTIGEGTVQTTSGSAIADAARVVLANAQGVSLDLNNVSETIGSLSGGGSLGGDIALGSGTLTTGDGTNTTYSGAISGTGGLTKTGSGVMTVLGNSTFSGTTAVNAGTLLVGSTNALGGTAGGTTVASGATLGLLNGITLPAGETLTLSGSGATGGALLNVSGSNSIGSPNASSPAVVLGADATIFSTSGVLVLGNGDPNASATAIDTTAANYAVIIGGAGITTVNSRIIGSGVGPTVTKNGQGTLNLVHTQASNEIGALNVNAGTVAATITSGTISALGSANLVLGGGNLNLTTSAAAITTANNASVTGSTTLRNSTNAVTLGTLTFNTPSATLTLGSGGGTAANIGFGATTIQGNRSAIFNIDSGRTLTLASLVGDGDAGEALIKVGTGTLTVSGAHTDYAGSVTVNQGTLQIGNANALGTGTLTLTSTATLSIGVAGANLAGVQVAPFAFLQLSADQGGVAAPTAAIDGIVTVDVSQTALTTAMTFNAGAQIRGKQTSGVAARTYAGDLVLNNTGALGSLFNNQTIFNSFNAGANAGDTLVIDGVISGTGGIYKGAVALAGNTGMNTGNSGTLQLNGANTYTGGTTLSNGTIILGAAGTMGDAALGLTAVSGGALLNVTSGGVVRGDISVSSGTLRLASNTGVEKANGLTLTNSGVVALNTNGQLATVHTLINAASTNGVIAMGGDNATFAGTADFSLIPGTGMRLGNVGTPNGNNFGGTYIAATDGFARLGGGAGGTTMTFSAPLLAANGVRVLDVALTPVQLAGSSHDFIGGTLVTSGTLQFSAGAVLPAGDIIVSGSGTLSGNQAGVFVSPTPNATTVSVNSGALFQVSDAGAIANVANTPVTIFNGGTFRGGVIGVNASNVAINKGATLDLSVLVGAGSTAPATAVNGTVQLATGTSPGFASGVLTLAPGGRLRMRVDGTGIYQSTIQLNSGGGLNTIIELQSATSGGTPSGSITLNNATGGSLVGTGGLTVLRTSASGTLTLTPAGHNTYSGGTEINGGIVDASGAAAFASLGTGTVNINTYYYPSGGAAGTTTSGQLNASARTLLAPDGTTPLAINVNGGGVMQLAGTSGANLSGVAVNGPVGVFGYAPTSGGLLTITGNLTGGGSGSIIPPTAPILGTLQISANQTDGTAFAGDVVLGRRGEFRSGVANLTYNGGLTLVSAVPDPTNPQAVVNTQGNNTTINGVISGTGGLIKQGTGNLILGNNNTYTGTTSINNGVVSIGKVVGPSAVFIAGPVEVGNSSNSSAGFASLRATGFAQVNSTVRLYNTAQLHVDNGDNVANDDSIFFARGGTLVLTDSTLSTGTGAVGPRVNGASVGGIIALSPTGAIPPLVTSADFDFSELNGAQYMRLGGVTAAAVTFAGALRDSSGVGVGILRLGGGGGAGGIVIANPLLGTDVGTLDLAGGPVVFAGGSANTNTGRNYVGNMTTGNEVFFNETAGLGNGGLTVTGGTIRAGGGALQFGSGTIYQTGGTIQTAPLPFSTTPSAYSGAVYVSGGTFDARSTQDALANVNVGSGGTLLLSSNSYVSVPSVFYGRLQGAQTAPTQATFNMAEGALLSGTFYSPLPLRGVVQTPGTGGGSPVFNGPLSDAAGFSGTLWARSGGTVTLSQLNTYTGGTRVVDSGTTLAISSTGSIRGNLVTSGVVNVALGGTIGNKIGPVNGQILVLGGGALGFADPSAVPNNDTVTLNNNSQVRFTQDIGTADFGTLGLNVKLANWTTNPTNTTLALTAPVAARLIDMSKVAPGMRLGAASNAVTMVGTLLDDTPAHGTGVLRLGGGGQTLTIDSVIAAANVGSVNVASGTVVLAAQNTYTGGTVLNNAIVNGTVVGGGTLTASVAGALGTGTVTVNANTTLNLNANNAASGAITVSGGTLNLAAADAATGGVVVGMGPAYTGWDAGNGNNGNAAGAPSYNTGVVNYNFVAGATVVGGGVTANAGGQINLAAGLQPTSADRFTVNAFGALFGTPAQLSAMTVGDNLILAPQAIISHNNSQSLTTLSAGDPAGLGTTPLYYLGLRGVTGTFEGSSTSPLTITVGTGTASPYRGLAADVNGAIYGNSGDVGGGNRTLNSSGSNTILVLDNSNVGGSVDLVSIRTTSSKTGNISGSGPGLGLSALVTGGTVGRNINILGNGQVLLANTGNDFVGNLVIGDGSMAAGGFTNSTLLVNVTSLQTFGALGSSNDTIALNGGYFGIWGSNQADVTTLPAAKVLSIGPAGGGIRTDAHMRVNNNGQIVATTPGTTFVKLGQTIEPNGSINGRDLYLGSAVQLGANFSTIEVIAGNLIAEGAANFDSAAVINIRGGSGGAATGLRLDGAGVLATGQDVNLIGGTLDLRANASQVKGGDVFISQPFTNTISAGPSTSGTNGVLDIDTLTVTNAFTNTKDPLITLTANSSSGFQTRVTGAVTLGNNLSVSGNGGIIFDNGVTFSGVATRALYRDGSGTLTINGTNSLTGPTVIRGGAIAYGSAAAMGGVGNTLLVLPGATAAFNFAMTQTELNRAVAQGPVIDDLTRRGGGTIALGVNNANNLTFAALPTYRLGGSDPTVGANYTGVLTAGSNGYLLGGGGGILNFTAANSLTGGATLNVANGSSTGVYTPSGVTAPSGGNIVLAAAQNFTGATVVTAGGALTLADDNAVQNSLSVSARATIANGFAVTAIPGTNGGDNLPLITSPGGLFQGDFASLTNTFGTVLLDPARVAPANTYAMNGGGPGALNVTLDGGAIGFTGNYTLQGGAGTPGISAASYGATVNSNLHGQSMISQATTGTGYTVIAPPAVPTNLLHLGGNWSTGTINQGVGFSITDNGATPVALVKSGSGSVLDLTTATVANTFTGGLSVVGGQVWVSNANQLGSGSINVGAGSGAELRFTGFVSPLTFSNTLRAQGTNGRFGPWAAINVETGKQVNYTGFLDNLAGDSGGTGASFEVRGGGTFNFEPRDSAGNLIALPNDSRGRWSFNVTEDSTLILNQSPWGNVHNASTALVLAGGTVTYKNPPTSLISVNTTGLNPANATGLDRYGFQTVLVSSGTTNTLNIEPGPSANEANIFRTFRNEWNYQGTLVVNGDPNNTGVFRDADGNYLSRVTITTSNGGGVTLAAPNGVLDLRNVQYVWAGNTGNRATPNDSTFVVKLNDARVENAGAGGGTGAFAGPLYINEQTGATLAQVGGGLSFGGTSVAVTSWRNVLEKVGTGTFSLSRATGSTVVVTGTIANPDPVLRVSYGTVDIGGADPFTDTVDPNKHVALDVNANLNISGSTPKVVAAITNSVPLRSGLPTGVISVSAGATLSAQSIVNNRLGLNGTSTSAANFAIRAAGASTLNELLVTTTNGLATLDLQNAGTTLTIGSLVTLGTGTTLTKAGPGALTFASTASVGAGVGSTLNLTGGTLNSNTRLGESVLTLSMSGGSTANFNVSQGLAGLAVTGGTGTVNTATGTTTTLGFLGNVNLAAGATLEKFGAGTLVINSAQTYGAGSTLNINDGTVVIGQNVTAGPAININTGSTLAFRLGITVSASAPLTLNGQGFDSLGALRNLSGNNTFTGDITLDADSTIGGVAGSLTLSGVISDSGPTNLNKIGAFNLILSGANTFTGNLSVDEGTLSVSSIDADPTAAQPLGASDQAISVGTATVATLAYNGSANATLNRGVIVGGAGGAIVANNGTGTLTLDTAGSTSGVDGTGAGYAVTFSGTGNTTILSQVSGTGTVLTKQGTGTLTLGGTLANTYTGATVVEAGTLALNKVGVNAVSGALNQPGGTTVLLANNQISDASTVTLSGGTLDIGTFSDTVGTLVLSNGQVLGTSGVLSGANNFDVRHGLVLARLGGAVGLDKTTSGTVQLSGFNTYTGATTVSAGALRVDRDAVFGATSAINLAGGTLQLTRIYVDAEHAFNVSTATSRIDVARGSVGATLALPINGTGTLTKTGRGTLFVTYDNPVATSYSGNVVLAGGGNGVTLRGAGTLLNIASATVGVGDTLSLDNNTGYPSQNLGDRLADSATVTLGGGGLVLAGPSANAAASETIGNLSLTSGMATVQVNRNNNGGTASVDLTAGGSTGGVFSRAAGSAVRFASGGTDAGTLGNTGSNPRIVLSGFAQANLTNGLIGAYALAQSGGNQPEFASYLDGQGVGGIGNTGGGFAGYSPNDLNASASTDNVRNTATITLTADRTANSLTLGTAAQNIAFATTSTILSITSGGIVVQNVDTVIGETAISAGILTTPASELFLHVNGGTTTVNTQVTGDSVTLVKTLGGTLAMANLNTANTYGTSGSVGTYVLGGTLTTGTTAAKTYLGDGQVVVENAVLTLGSTGATANASGDDYTIRSGGQVNLANLAYGGTDTFNIGADSVVAGSTTALGSLTRGTNITLAGDAVVAVTNFTDNSANGTGAATIQNLGTAADLYFGLGADTGASTARSVLIGAGTPWKGMSTDRGTANQTWQGTINVADGTSSFDLRGFAEPGAASNTLILGGTGSGIALQGTGAVVANILENVQLNSAGLVLSNRLTLEVQPGSTLTVNTANGMGGSGSANPATTASARVTSGGALGIGSAAALNGAVNVLPGGRLIASQGGGLTGTGAVSLYTGSIVEITNAAGFSGTQAAAASITGDGLIVRLASATINTATTNLDDLVPDTAIYELFNTGTVTYFDPAAPQPIMTLAQGTGVSGLLTNDGTSRTLGATANGYIAIAAAGGRFAATDATVLTVNEDFDLGANTLTIGLDDNTDGQQKLGTVALGSTANAALNGSTIAVISSATLRNAAADVVPDLSVLTINSGGTYNLNNFNETIGALTGSGTVTNTGAAVRTLTIGASNNLSSTFAGTLTASTPANLAVTKTGTGTLTLTGTSTHAGLTTVNGGTLAYGVNDALGSGPVTVSGATLSMGAFTDTVGTVTLQGGGQITGSGTLSSTGTINVESGTVSANLGGTAVMNKTTVSTVTLTGDNTFSGGTNVNAGLLLVNNSTGSGTGSGAVTVTGGTLGGSGTIAGAITVNTTGVLSPGTSPGILTGEDGLDLSGNGTYLWEVASLTSFTPGTDFDVFNLTGGNLVLGGTSKLTLSFGPGLSPDQGNSFWNTSHPEMWKIIDLSGTAANPGDSNFFQINATYWTTGFFFTSVGTGANTGDIYLNFQVPEPGTLALLALGSATLLRRRRRSDQDSAPQG